MVATRARRTIASLTAGGQLGRIKEEVQAALRKELPDSHSDSTLERLLSHTSATVPAYRGIAFTSLEDFPVVNKTDIKAAPERFISSAFRPRSLTTVSTSGSTGVPFVSYRDPGKRLRHHGSLVGTFEFQGADPFGPRVVSKAWGANGLNSKLRSYLQQEVQHSGGSVMLPGTRDLASWFKRHPGALLMGYSSYLEQILRELDTESRELPLPLGALIGASEPASDYLINQAPRVFGTHLKMRYSNMENGMIAVTDQDLDRYHVDVSSFRVEILREENDCPAAIGETGRLVVTDLFNYGMPFIRYDTGDLAAWSTDPGRPLQRDTVTRISGRRLDQIIISAGDSPRTAHALQIWAPTAKLSEITQFQLRQKDIGRFEWILNAQRSDALEETLRHILIDRIGPVEYIGFEYVDHVPVLASGKRQFFVNEIPDDLLQQ